MKGSILSALFCIFFLCGAVSAQGIKTGMISGQLMLKAGGPMSGGQVFFFNDAWGPPPSQEMYLRIPDFAANLDKQGKFSIQIPEGKYYLGAIKRVSGEKIGPPRDDDFFFASMNEKGLPKAYLVEQGKKLDIGVIAEAIPFKKAAVASGSGITAIEGAVLDRGGNPVEGALVLAYTIPTMAGKPLFASEKTLKNGRYLLRVYGGGNYYLRVRSVYGGGPPTIGEMVGVYGETGPAAVAVKQGQIMKGIDIKAVKFQGRGTMTGPRARNNEPPPVVK